MAYIRCGGGDNTPQYDSLINQVNWYPSGATTRTFTTTKKYRFIIGSIAPGKSSGNVGYGNITVNKGTRGNDKYSTFTNSNYCSGSLRQVVYQDVPAGAVITAAPPACDNCVIEVIGII